MTREQLKEHIRAWIQGNCVVCGRRLPGTVIFACAFCWHGPWGFAFWCQKYPDEMLPEMFIKMKGKL